ncbi:MAG: cold shock domain-containing protein [Phycisphaeraceae bacterium]
MATQGQVKWFDPKKGYGFIIGPAGQDVFVHYTQIMGDGFRSLKDGESVDYDIIQGEKGYQAKSVQRQAAAAAQAEAAAVSTGYRKRSVELEA